MKKHIITNRTIIGAGYGYRSDGRRTIPDCVGTIKTIGLRLDEDLTLKANRHHMSVQLFIKIDGEWVPGGLYCGVCGEHNTPCRCSLNEAADPEYRSVYGDVVFISDCDMEKHLAEHSI